MKILVAVKRVVDYNIKVRINADHTNVDLDGVKMSMNPFCEIAVEQAVRLKEQGQADEVVVVSIGEKKAQDQIRHALAMGADSGILIETDEELEPLTIAKALHKVISEEKPDLVLMGKQSIDGDNAQTSLMLSALMDCPVAHCASELSLQSDKAVVRYEVEDGENVANLSLPAVISADLRLAEPRFVKLPNIMKAKKKPLAIKALADVLVTNKAHQKRVSLTPPVSREGNTLVCDTAKDFVDQLKLAMEG
jgi:electron transfer flavoprotein beta subunit